MHTIASTCLSRMLTAGLIIGMPVTSAPVCAELPPDPGLSFHSGWQNRYVLEGREVLEDGGIYTIEGAADWKGFNAGVRYTRGDSSAYEEVNFNLVYGFEGGPVQSYFGYKHLRFLEDAKIDNELNTGFQYNLPGNLSPAVNYTHSMQAGGGFLEISLHTHISAMRGRLWFEPYIREGLDYGYISKTGNGAKNLQFGIQYACELNKHMVLTGSVNHSWTHADHPDFDDVTWATFGVSFDPMGNH